jgi:hypothetical protein
MKKIEILKHNRPIKVKKKKLKQPHMMEIDFTSISKLVGNKIMLENIFQITKNECLNG